MKDSFVLKTSWKSVFDDLGDKQAGVLIKAVFNYMATGEKPTTQSDLEIKMAFKFISIDLNIFNENYEKRCRQNRENGMKGAEFGKLGGRPRKHEEPPKTPQGDIKTPKTPDNENDKDIKEKNINTKKENEIKKRKEAFYDECAKFVDKYPPDMLRKFFDYWTEHNKSGTKMRFESEKTWELSKRLSRWANNQNGYGKG